jgi:hypothetical protein
MGQLFIQIFLLSCICYHVGPWEYNNEKVKEEVWPCGAYILSSECVWQGEGESGGSYLGLKKEGDNCGLGAGGAE